MDFLDLIPEVIFEIDKDLKINFINASSEKVTGYKQNELKGKKIRLKDFFAKEEIPRIQKSISENFKGNHITGNQYKAFDKNGNEIVFKIHNYPIKKNGEIVALRCLAINITDQEKQIHALTGKEYHYRQIFLNSPIAYQSLNKDGILINVNPAWEKIIGYKHEEIVGKSLKYILHDDYKQKFDETFLKFKEKGDINHAQYKLKRKDGEIIDVEYNGKVEYSPDGNYVRSHCVLSDITSQIQAEKTLKRSEKRFRELNATKDKFFSIIAHDLKNPFNDLIGFTQLLASNINKYDKDKIEQFVQIIHQSSKLAYGLLENLLEWSRTQTGTLKYRPDIIDLRRIVKDNIELMHSNAQNKDIKITSEIVKNTTVFADKNMIHTVIRNLISNAIKYTNNGGYVRLTGKPLKQFIEIKVEDNGVGIDSENVQKLFRIDESYTTPGTQREKGTGLGLILCKEFIEKNGGEIKINSRPGKGTTFSFTLPTNKSH
ncbi:MAG: PAS domain S-box protein [Bacteroidota bacterium]